MVQNLNPQDISLKSEIKSLREVTPLSRYLAMVLFVVLPFVGGLIGYTTALDNVPASENIIIEKKNVYATDHSVTENLDRSKSMEKHKTLKSYALAGGYRIESYRCDNIAYVDEGDDCYRVVKETPEVIVTDITRLYQEIQGTDKVLGKQYFPKDGNEIYFYLFYPSSSVCCGIVKFNPVTTEFTPQGGYLPASGEEVSPSGRYIATSKNGKEVLITDIVTNSITQRKGVGDDKTLISSRCGYDGSILDFEWLNDDTLEYGVYDKASLEIDICEGKLIEIRQLKIK